uniref:STAS/SEC14 domain-containing protein n=1 Tax=Ningiella ruwaisensis TaxID=2364274 RepID=UPI00109F1D33|nr:STAS/SEC14 domain-containing protein [Ningiella ruwaisensis]
MLDIIDIKIDNAVAFKMSGRITENDMSVVLAESRFKSERFKKIVIYEEIESFSGIDFSAIAEEIKYLYKVGISNIDKVAVVADKGWIEKIVKIEDKLFSNIHIKYFKSDEKDEAIRFLKE